MQMLQGTRLKQWRLSRYSWRFSLQMSQEALRQKLVGWVSFQQVQPLGLVLCHSIHPQHQKIITIPGMQPSNQASALSSLVQRMQVMLQQQRMWSQERLLRNPAPRQTSLVCLLQLKLQTLISQPPQQRTLPAASKDFQLGPMTRGQAPLAVTVSKVCM